jgi:beta-lactamase superfamily II metal-dependent hydrolase
MLPAAHGDALWIEYGPADQVTRIVIDGGPASTYARGLRARIERMKALGSDRIDLFVITHIDCDHIDGAIIFLRECRRLKIKIREIWFNAWKHLPESTEALQPLQGEFLGALIETDAQFERIWNRRFDGQRISVISGQRLPVVKLPNGARLTVLSPFAKQLFRLRSQWESAIRDFTPGDERSALERLDQRRDYRPPSTPDTFAAHTYGADRSPPNGSSIAFLLEYGNRSCLFAGDAHARVLTESLKMLARERGTERIKLDAFKLPHHGSMGNVTQELLQLVDCKTWMVSTNGAIFHHPDRAAIELIAGAHERSTFLCNYRVPATLRLAPKRTESWVVKYPDPDDRATAGPIGGFKLDLLRKVARKKAARKTARTARPRARAAKKKVARRGSR